MPTLAQIARHLDLDPPAGAAEVVIDAINTLDDATPAELTFLCDPRYAARLKTTRAAAVLVTRGLPTPADRPFLEVDNGEAAANAVLELLALPVPRPPAGVDPSARVAPSAVVGEGAAVGPNCVVGERVRLGAGCVLHAGVVLHDDVTLGDSCELFANVVVRERCSLGDRVVVHANSVIGTDGFGYRFDGRRHVKVPHVGTVVIEADVEIGSCTTIDRGKFAETRVGAGSKIDNLVQIAHNVRIGRLCIVCANAGIAGSTTLGDGVVLAGGAGIKDHVHLGAGARIAAMTGVGRDVAPKETLMGALYGMPQKQFLREQAAMRRLPELSKQVKELQKQVDALRAAIQ